MEVDTENVRMDKTDINSNDNDEAPTVEESYEITTTRRKTIRTSYKIQEVSCQRQLHSWCPRSP